MSLALLTNLNLVISRGISYTYTLSGLKVPLLKRLLMVRGTSPEA